MADQLSLNLVRPPSYARGAFVVSPSSAAAVKALDAWPDGRAAALVLVGPPGSGKTHLARVWAERVGAVDISLHDPQPTAPGRPMLVDDADCRLEGEALFHLLNFAASRSAGLLMTARIQPSAWPSDVPDLRSRLNALPIVKLEEPDDTALAAILAKAFDERNIRPPKEVLDYLISRIERSASSARAIAALLDTASGVARRRLSIPFARQVLERVCEAGSSENAASGPAAP